MRLSIGVRVFAMALLSMMAITAMAVVLVRWGFSGSGAPLDAHAAQSEVNSLSAAMADAYRTRGDWSAVPADARDRERWWRAQAQRATSAEGMPVLSERASLLDAQGRILVGEAASPLLVALVSLDRVRRGIVVNGHAVGYVTVAQPRDAGDALTLAFLIRQQRHLLALMGFGLLLGAVVAALLGRQVRRPVAALAKGARQLGAGQYDVPIDTRRRDELGDLARTFQTLASRLKAADQARRQWLADTSHELRTPLAVLRAQLEAMQDGVRPASPETMAPPLNQVAALSSLVDDLHQLALADAGAWPLQPVSLDVGALVRAVWQEFMPRLASRTLHGTLREAQTPAVASVDPQRLRQVLTNLLENSLRYTAPGGRVAMAVEATDAGCRVTLDDTAPGVADEARERLGERFFRVEPSRGRAAGGAGLGLALSRQWMRAQGGDLRFEPSPLGGLRVLLNLPREA